MRVSVIGTGYVGLVTGTCFAELVTMSPVSILMRKNSNFTRWQVPIYEPGLQELIDRNVAPDGWDLL